ncbi:MAG TPA: PP2C family serine/threonine-protein phosphatase [Pyrinomonadaceae bacterium]|nr:PP2C family serine/threonine-protein phosphatase [Pyrinomonadaceae bacterium]
MFVELYAQTDVGRVRQGNEDNFLVLDLASGESWSGSDEEREPPEKIRRFEVGKEGLVLIVSDGMGGALAGDVASRMAVESVREMLTEEDSEHKTDPQGSRVSLVDCLCNATGYANYAIHRKSLEDPRCSGMGATLTAAAVSRDSMDFVQVGDSRAYVIRGDEIKLATKDQSLVQQLVDVGQITEEDAETHMFRNVILQALGAQSDLTPVVSRVRLQRGDMMLLCSDGLSGKMRAEEMLQIVDANDGDLAAACDALVNEANRRGGEDNITVVLARFDGEDLAAPSHEPIAVELAALEDDKTLPGMDDDTSPLP